ncbi:peptidoglycan recognition protein family protein [Streptomyces fradiae]|uniref:N-acetylmuramoyl-L-alanine amidase n=1 Tax=Streptomyces fradiae TaxID=1906 RepID=UPI0029421605|nr:N-acetylmuramoyl-L-alanine amidase [Streptomyces fradiae]WOI58596.1 N-acetylmuramoyl-L-alanine amidase [Streptomyces fradiae]
MRLVSRAQWGARAYRLPSGGTLYAGARRGVKIHYLGTAYADRPHEQCAAYVRQIQAQHMDGNGWSDIGYSFAVCTHGYVYEGRGLRRRNSANGSTSLNNQDYAVLAMVGSSGLTVPTSAQLHGLRDAIDHCRREGPAGPWLGGHRDGYATSCPGDWLHAWAHRGAPRPDTEEDDVPLTTDDIKRIAHAVWAWQNKAIDKRDMRQFVADAANHGRAAAVSGAAAVAGLGELDARLAEIAVPQLSNAHITALADQLAASPAFRDAIREGLADAVADKLAARLKD